MAEPYVGRSLRRLEDPHLLTGRGRFAADVAGRDSLHMAVVRSHLAHARVRSIDVTEAESTPGVVAVWTAEELPPGGWIVDDLIPPTVRGNARPLLAGSRVRYSGEPLAVVFATGPEAAADAAATVMADLEPLPVVINLAAAATGGAPELDPELPGNLVAAGTVSVGEVDDAFDGPAFVAAVHIELPRICGAAMEPRSVTAIPLGDRIRVWTSTQAIFSVRRELARILQLEPKRVEVVAEDVGGGFGPKAAVYSEEGLVALAAWRLGRPVTWTATRSEDFATTFQSHGVRIEAELAAHADGRIRGLRGRVDQECGAYPSVGMIQATSIITHLLSTYVVPALSVVHRTLLTNAVPIGAVRGGSRPVGNYVIERLMDRLATISGIDRVELRERNLVRPEQMPYDTGLPLGGTTAVYDSGDFPRLLRTAVEAIGYRAGVAQPSDGVRGIGIACGAETTGFGASEPARVVIQADGWVTLSVGSTPQGQGHRTMAAQVLADRLGWPLERVKVNAGDSAEVEEALVTGGSRTALFVGNATAQVAAAARTQLLALAANALEANPADVVLDPISAAAAVRGVPSRRLPFASLMPAGGLEVADRWHPPGRATAWASSCHAAVVHLDPETGSVEVERYVIAHDCGRAINPMTVRGQLLGGLVHGFGYALHEEARYDADGQLVTSSFLDYSTPTAPDVHAAIELIDCSTDTAQNPEGFKGVGESASVMAPAAIASAVEDALRRVNPDAVVANLPLTSDRVFELGQMRARRP